jgi:tight adherence protein B
MSPLLIIVTVVAGVLLLGSALVVLGLNRVAIASDPVLERIHTYGWVLEDEAPVQRGGRRSVLARLRVRLNAALSALGSENLGLELARANWPITVPEYVLLRLGLTVLAVGLGWIIGRSAISGVGLAVIVYFVPVVLLRRSISQRQTQFGKQLVDVLVLMTGSVRAGHSLLQSMEVVSREMRPPAGDEFTRVVREVGLGRRLPEALKNLSARMQNSDLDLVVTSIDIQYTVGGNIAVILAAVTETIRERIRLFGEVRVLTTQQRYSSYLISVLPFIVGGLLFLWNPSYILLLWDPRIRCIPIGALAGLILGHFVLQRIAKIDV